MPDLSKPSTKYKRFFISLNETIQETLTRDQTLQFTPLRVMTNMSTIKIWVHIWGGSLGLMYDWNIFSFQFLFYIIFIFINKYTHYQKDHFITVTLPICYSIKHTLGIGIVYNQEMYEMIKLGVSKY